MAGRLRSPQSALERPGRQNQGLADWPLSGNRNGCFGHGILSDDRPLPGSEVPLAAFRQSILEGDSRVGAHSGHPAFSRAVSQQNPDFATWMLRTGHWRPHPTGQERPLGLLLNSRHWACTRTRKQPLNWQHLILLPDRPHCSGCGQWRCRTHES